MIIIFLFSLMLLFSSNNLLINKNLAYDETKLDLPIFQMNNAYGVVSNADNFNFVALGDLSYDDSAECWLELIEPIVDRTKITIGNHENESSTKLKDFMEFFKLE